jgi:hypothetical protein
MDLSREPIKRIAVIVGYIALTDLVFFLFLKKLLFVPVGLTTTFSVAVFGLSTVVVLSFFAKIPMWGKRQSLASFALMFASAAALSILFARAVRLVPTVADSDWTWMRVEMIKTPLWVWLHVGYAPFFSAALIGVLVWWIYLSEYKPKSLVLRLGPLVCAAIMAGLMVDAFGWTTRYLAAYVLFFVVPLLIFSVFLIAGRFRFGFLLVPLVFHSILTGFSYAGYFPLTLPRSDAAIIAKIPGARLLLPAGDDSVKFLQGRQMVLMGRRLLFASGPMGVTQLISYDLDTGQAVKIEQEGLLREIQASPDGDYAIAVNWQLNDILVYDPVTLATVCKEETSEAAIYTPWGLQVDGDRAFLSNVTPPLVSRLGLSQQNLPCGFQVERSVDLFRSGYIDNTDGVYGLHLDREKNRLYAAVGLFGGQYVTSVTELDTETLEVLGDVKFPGATMIVPIPGSDRVLVPSYYFRKIFEVSLSDLRVTREIRADASTFGLAYDAKRRIIYGVSRVSGKLSIIDDETGATLLQVYVGKSPGGLAVDAKADKLYLGSGLGLMEIDLKTLFARLSGV